LEASFAKFDLTSYDGEAQKCGSQNSKGERRQWAGSSLSSAAEADVGGSSEDRQCADEEVLH
jgi:hypothetical protein